MRLTQNLQRAFLRPVSDRRIQDGPALSHAVSIVRKVLAENPNPQGWRTAEIYEMALKEPSPEGFKSTVPVDYIPTPPPHPEHPIRSRQFLKEVLSQMESYKDVKLYRTVRQREGSSSTSTVFAWKVFDKSTLPKTKPVVERGPTVSQAVGGHEDWGHLNRRRLRSRRASILADIHQIKGNPVELIQ